jgi:arylsulfatase A-like enzyme
VRGGRRMSDSRRSRSRAPRGAHRGAQILSASLLASLLLAGCPPADVAPPRPCVLVLTIDRFANLADPEVPIPHLDALMAEGVVFEDAVAASPDLRANCAAILTGLHPSNSGCHTLFQPVSAESWTMAERCYEQDVWTGAIVAVAPMANALGLEQGFEEYDGQLYSGPDQVVPIARQWLGDRAKSDGGFLIWLHLGGETLAPVDKAVGVLRSTLDELGLEERTTVVLAGTRGIVTPDDLAMSVPLVIYHPDSSPAVRGERVGLIDIAPTATELLIGHPGDGHDATSLVGPVLGLPADQHAVATEVNLGEVRIAYCQGWRSTRHIGQDPVPLMPPGNPPREVENALRVALGAEPLPETEPE